MATVGLNFGSATSGAGFDVTAAVTSILALESQIETPWKAQLSSLKAQDTALTSLGTGLSSLSTALSALTSFDGVLAAKQGSSSDTNTLALTAASYQASAGSHTVVVTSLAQTSSKYSDRVANASDTLSGSVSIKVGSGSAQTITLDSTNNTLAKLASAINYGTYGVTASVVSDTQGSRLSLVSQTSGAGGEISLTANVTDTTTSTALNFQTGQTGADAVLKVDGLNTTSASNTVTGAIPGVTFQLLQAPPNTTVQIQITNDNSSIANAVQSFVTAYNAVASQIKTQEGKDANGVAEPLYGDPTLSLLQSQLAGALSGGTASGTIKSLSQIGVTVGPTGQLTLDTTALTTALNAHFSDVTGFLQNAGSFGQTFTTVVNGLGTSNTKGALSLALSENATKEAGINTNIAKEDARLATEKTRLTAELNLANQILQSIPQQLAEINQVYSALTGYNTKG